MLSFEKILNSNDIIELPSNVSELLFPLTSKNKEEDLTSTCKFCEMCEDPGGKYTLSVAHAKDSHWCPWEALAMPCARKCQIPPRTIKTF